VPACCGIGRAGGIFPDLIPARMIAASCRDSRRTNATPSTSANMSSKPSRRGPGLISPTLGTAGRSAIYQGVHAQLITRQPTSP
jgi:hypothetical protein